MGFWSWITGGGKAVDAAATIATDISSGIDVMFYTDEEKAQAKQKATETWLKLFEIEKDAAGPRAITRRIIAVAITVQWILMLNAGLIFLITGNIVSANAVFDLMPTVTAAVGAILGFYFGPNMIARAVRDSKNSK